MYDVTDEQWRNQEFKLGGLNKKFRYLAQINPRKILKSYIAVDEF
jgi:hypothetical protein